MGRLAMLTHEMPPIAERDEDALIEILNQTSDTRKELENLPLRLLLRW
jgi:hypothetical protein